MKCPFCSKVDNKVIDSRLSKDTSEIRRRRECLVCSRRFTTYEHIEDIPVMIIKKDGRREVFSRIKVKIGLQKACEKRDVSVNTIEEIVDALERDLRDSGEKELKSRLLGEMIMEKLQGLDEVAYVRFASVYREFKDVNDFVDELKTFLVKKPEIKGYFTKE